MEALPLEAEVPISATHPMVGVKQREGLNICPFACVCVWGGGFGARIGQKRSPLTGKFELAKTTSDNGMRLLDFADAYELVITNTLFQHKHIHTATWYPPSGCLQPSVKDFI